MNRSIFVVFLILTASFPGAGQKIVPTASDLYSDVLEYMYAGDYAEALPILLNLQEKGYNTANISYKIGECYLNMQGLKTKAIPYLKEAGQKISSSYTGNTIDEEFAPVKSLLYLGIAYRLNNDLDNALVFFNTYLNSVDDVDKENRSLAMYHIERCENARDLMATPAKFKTDTLSEQINSLISNSNPLVSAGEGTLYYMNQLKFYDAVMRTVQTDKVWQEPENLTPKIKSDGDHYLTGLSNDGSRLYLTFADPYLNGEIYTTTFRNGRWSELHKLNNNINTIFNETHASPSPDGQFLYFTSDRKGGYGGLDIYRSAITPSGEYGIPVSLGPLINTPYNEESPFVSSDNRQLFFSSQGHYNMGGYDVFTSEMDNDGNWQPPLNLGYPINTTDDDLFFFPIGDGRIAYQSRYSANTAQQDILRYSITSLGNPARFTVKGKISLTADSSYSPGKISVAFINKDLLDTVAHRRIQDNGTFSQKLPGGAYRLDFSNEAGSLITKDFNIPDNFPHNELILLNTDIIIPSRIIHDTAIIKDIRFAFGKSLLEDRYQLYLNEILTCLLKYPDLSLQINGYADSKGSENYNLMLSLSRARAVENYLKSNGTPGERISVNAFGEKNSIAVNRNSDGTDNPLGRSYNRRVELLFTNVPSELVIIRHQDIPENLINR